MLPGLLRGGQGVGEAGEVLQRQALLVGDTTDDANDHQQNGKTGQQQIQTHNRRSFLLDS